MNGSQVFLMALMVLPIDRFTVRHPRFTASLRDDHRLVCASSH